jgi:HlyD family secretion protein
MKHAFRWGMSALLLALMGAGAWLGLHAYRSLATLASPTVGTLSSATQAVTVTATPVSAVGTIELISKRQIVLQTDGTIAEVAVEVGDTVEQGDLLVALDTQPLEWAVQEADIGLENARIALEQATEAVDQGDIDVAEATLLLAQEQLALVEAGPTQEQLEAVRAGAAAAWAAYEELQAGPSPEELTQLSAALKQAEIALQQAQRAYDRIAWQPDAGASSEGAALQSASIDYEAAKAAYDELVKPASVSELQGALSTAQSAQDALNELQKKPTPAELAEARAAVVAAEAALADLEEGADAADVRAAELGVQSAQIALEQARRNLNNARVLAPVGGVVLTVDVEVGAQGSAGTVIATISDPSKLRAVVNVEQKDIPFVQVGQTAQVTVYGLTDRVYEGVVDKIAPQGTSDTGSIAFPVTIRFTEESVTELKPGMSATATFVGDETSAEEPAAEEDTDSATPTEAASTEEPATEGDTERATPAETPTAEETATEATTPDTTPTAEATAAEGNAESATPAETPAAEETAAEDDAASEAQSTPEPTAEADE